MAFWGTEFQIAFFKNNEINNWQYFFIQSINGWKEIDVLKRINYRGKLAYSTLAIDYVFVDNL